MKLNKIRYEKSSVPINMTNWTYILCAMASNAITMQHLSNGYIYGTTWLYLR